MGVRTAVTAAVIVIVVKAALIAGAWQNRCALMGRCAPAPTWWPVVGAACGALAIVAAVLAAWRLLGRGGDLRGR
ncbi:MAG: hypothetical protein ACM4D3_05590 [Candidatus Sericytochromatia bacterium]